MTALVLWGAGALYAPVPALSRAQSEKAGIAQEDKIGPMLERAREAYQVEEPPPPPPADCAGSDDENTIIVCAPTESDPDRYRVPSRLESGDDSHLEWTGQAPDVSGPGIFKGPATVSGLCIIPPCPKPPVYMIDFSTLPDAPPGSDADRIGRGLAPRGSQYDDGEIAEDETEPGAQPDVLPDTPANTPEDSPAEPASVIEDQTVNPSG